MVSEGEVQYFLGDAGPSAEAYGGFTGGNQAHVQGRPDVTETEGQLSCPDSLSKQAGLGSGGNSVTPAPDILWQASRHLDIDRMKGKEVQILGYQ